MFPMPLKASLGAMPFVGALDVATTGCPSSFAWMTPMMPRMFCTLFKHQVLHLIVAAVMVAMMDMGAFRHRTVMRLPHDAMESSALALEVLPAEIVSDAFKELDRGTDDDDHA